MTRCIDVLCTVHRTERGRHGPLTCAWSTDGKFVRLVNFVQCIFSIGHFRTLFIKLRFILNEFESVMVNQALPRKARTPEQHRVNAVLSV
jgi:hypothetical protein